VILLGKHIYGEWLVPIVDYFRTIKKKEATFEWIIPLVIAIIVSLTFYYLGNSTKAVLALRNLLPSTLAILIGFSITCITVLISSSNNNIEKLKERKTIERFIGKELISIYQWVLIIFVYVLIVQIALLIFIFFAGFVLHIFNVSFFLIIALFIKTFLISHILLILIRNTTNFYFIFFKNDIG
jgi:hypothetical protein